jgi:hypothetical protein
LAHNSGELEVQGHGANICSTSGEGLLPGGKNHHMVRQSESLPFVHFVLFLHFDLFSFVVLLFF